LILIAVPVLVVGPTCIRSHLDIIDWHQYLVPVQVVALKAGRSYGGTYNMLVVQVQVPLPVAVLGSK